MAIAGDAQMRSIHDERGRAHIVETQAQMLRLAYRGCGLMQGFLFSRPVPPPEFAQLLARGARPDWRAAVRRSSRSGSGEGEGGGQ